MASHPTPTPEEVGHVIAIALARADYLSPSPQNELLDAAAVSAEAILGERLLLCISAVESGIRSVAPNPSLAVRMLSSMNAFFVQNQAMPSIAYVLREMHSTANYYAEAARDDSTLGVVLPREFSQVELALFDRLMKLGIETESRARACMKLSVGANDMWQVHWKLAMERFNAWRPA